MRGRKVKMKKQILLIGILLMTTVLMIPTVAESATEIWVVMHGRITSWGVTPVAFGWCGAFAKIDEWARVRAFWAPTIPPRPIDPGSSFTFSFYTARLVNASIIKLNYEGNDFYVSGRWDVYNVTFDHYGYGNFTLTIDVMANDANGTLLVPNMLPEQDFTINIDGIEVITGKVKFVCMKSIEIPIGDCSGPITGTPDRRIDIRDLVHIAKAYGSKPGMLKYDFSIDFDLDFDDVRTVGVGLRELTTIAANLGTEY